MKSLIFTFATLLATLATTVSSPSASAQLPQGDLIPLRVLDVKAMVAPTGSPSGGPGIARAALRVKVAVSFCRAVSPEQFSVTVTQQRRVQVLEIRDIHLADCRGMPQEQVVELYVPRVVAYKQTDVKNQLLISWR